MLPSTNLGTMPLDPNTQRAIEELALVINDVEQRLQLIRMSIAQAAPNSWPSFGHGSFPPTGSFGFGLGGNVPSVHGLLSNPAILQQLLAANVAKLHTGGIPPTFGGVSPFGGPLGVNAPFGFQSPFQAPFTPFRF